MDGIRRGLFLKASLRFLHRLRLLAKACVENLRSGVAQGRVPCVQIRSEKLHGELAQEKLAQSARSQTRRELAQKKLAQKACAEKFARRA